MREIKFGGQLRSGVWVYGGFYSRDGEGRIMPDNDTIPFAVNIETVGQFTGLLDRDGREIYEDDILKVCNGSINGHPWWENPFAVVWKPNGTFELPRYCWDKNGNDAMDSTHWCEVIGNIHENPDLLKAGKKDGR